MKKLIVLSTVFFVAMSAFLSPGLYAQDSIEEIVVTARKKEENLSEIPLSISVFSAKDIQESGFKNLEDLSLQVAGFQHSAQGGQAPGRTNSQLRFRGMNVNSLSEDPSFIFHYRDSGGPLLVEVTDSDGQNFSKKFPTSNIALSE